MTINLGGQLARAVLLIRTWYISVVHLSARPWRERSYFRAFWSPGRRKSRRYSWVVSLKKSAASLRNPPTSSIIDRRRHRTEEL